MQTLQANRILKSMCDQGLITEDEWRITHTECVKSGEDPKSVLLANGFLNESDYTEFLSKDAGVGFADLSLVIPDPEALATLPGKIAQQHRAVPVYLDTENGCVTVAISEIDDVFVTDAVRAALVSPYFVEFVLANEHSIVEMLDRSYGFELSINGILSEIETLDHSSDRMLSVENSPSHPVVRLVDAILLDAVKRNSSDIHFEPEAGYLRIRYRIDGVLRSVRRIHSSHWPACAARLKVVSSLNIAETRAPQDGSFSVSLASKRIDIRISTFPTLHGENIVLRILDLVTGLMPLENLGFQSHSLRAIETATGQPFGVVLVVGPTGSGKTTTLFSILQELNTEKINIMTLEDPVEYQIPLLRQCSVNHRVKMNFAEGVRSILRQDPDVILVGEIRDSTTAELTFRAAMTGHLVFATVHTYSALGAYQRLLDLGLSIELVARHVNGVISQRLVRKLCPHCKEPDSNNDTNETPSSSTSYRAGECRHCDWQGYKGRQVVAEVLSHDLELEHLLENGETRKVVSDYLSTTSFQSLNESGMDLYHRGITSYAEISRVIGGDVEKANFPGQIESNASTDSDGQKNAPIESTQRPFPVGVPALPEHSLSTKPTSVV